MPDKTRTPREGLSPSDFAERKAFLEFTDEHARALSGLTPFKVGFWENIGVIAAAVFIAAHDWATHPWAPGSGSIRPTSSRCSMSFWTSSV